MSENTTGTQPIAEPQSATETKSTDVSRRNFLAAGAAGAAAMAFPMIVGAQSKSGNAKPIIGDGDFKFEVEHDWGLANLPSGMLLGNCHSTVEDKNGHIYLHHTVHADSKSPDSVIEFDDKGKFVKSWGAMFRGGAHGMHYAIERGNEYLYFCDEKHGIVTKRTMKGEEVWTMGYPQWSPVYQKGPGSSGPGGANGLNYRPTNIAVNPANLDFWIGDGYGSYYMFHYKQATPTSYPEFVRTFGGRPAPAAPAGGGGQGKGKGGPPPEAAKGGPGGGPGGRGQQGPPPIDQTNNPHGNWIDTRDPQNVVLLIADRGNRRIVRYTLDDKPIDVIEGTQQPCHFHQRQDLLVVPDLAARVSIIKGNKVVATFGAPAEGQKNAARTTANRSDFIPGVFVNPHGATWDKNGNIFVAEWVEIGRFSKLRRV